MNPKKAVEVAERTEEEMFASLTESAFEFLTKALEEFPKSPKFSTVNFAIAIELFLKARLMKEHWSLIVERPEQADWKSFCSGESKTVGPEAAMVRLKNIARAPVSEDSQQAFKRIAAHRNKMVHFVHDGEKEAGNAKNDQIEVVVEQCQGWLALHQLLEKDWQEHFSEFDGRIAQITHKMGRHREFLTVKFQAVSEKIAAHLKFKRTVSNCPSCGFMAVLVTPRIGALSQASCLVCRYSGTEISVTCPEEDCGEHIKFDSHSGPPKVCPSCDFSIADWIPEALDTGAAINHDNYFDHIEKNCPYCSGYHTVVEHHNLFVCTQCFEFSDIMECCEYCSEGQLGGVSEFSYLSGCEFCDGKGTGD
jgi:hypothetical protein